MPDGNGGTLPRVTDSDTYRTDPSAPRSFFSRLFLSSPRMFYPQVFWEVVRASIKASRNRYERREWILSSMGILRALENVGIDVTVSGLGNVRALGGPAVFVSNHMSTLETFVLPGLIAPYHPVTFVVKRSLLTYPIFGAVIRAREPIAVGRENPREDLTTVLRGGAGKLAAGVSLVIFPQTTRTTVFDPANFNTLGVKLAARAKVPVVPVAVRTEAWGNGKRFKDFGPVDPSLPVHIEFGSPLQVEGRGTDAHHAIIDFIRTRLAAWGLPGRS